MQSAWSDTSNHNSCVDTVIQSDRRGLLPVREPIESLWLDDGEEESMLHTSVLLWNLVEYPVLVDPQLFCFGMLA